MESKQEIKRQGVRGGVVWREVGVWKTNLPKSIREGLCAKLSLTEILYSIKDLLIMPKHMKYSIHHPPPQFSSPYVPLLRYLQAHFLRRPPFIICRVLFLRPFFPPNNNYSETLWAQEKMRNTHRRRPSVCLFVFSVSAVLEVVSTCAGFCSVCQHQHKCTPQSHYHFPPTHTHKHTHTHGDTATRKLDYLQAHMDAHRHALNSIYQVHCDSNITGGASIKTNKLRTLSLLHFTASLPFSLSLPRSLYPLQELPPPRFIPPSIRRSSPRW